MPDSEYFRKQHKELLFIAEKMTELFDPEKLAEDANEMIKLLEKLIDILKDHFALEDKSLYPKLLEHPNSHIRETALKFINELVDLTKILSSYIKKWTNASVIQSNSSEFILETKDIFNALSNRIELEDNELYLIYESIK